MRNIFVVFLMFSSSFALAQDTTDTAATSTGIWPSYGYIGLAAIVLTVVIFMLIRKQYRKFNE